MKNTYAYYCEPVAQFLDDAKSGACLNALIASIPTAELGDRNSEIQSWKHNISNMAKLLAPLEVGSAVIAFELFVPLCDKRIDCALFGKNSLGQKNLTIIELKQWSNDRIHWAQDGCNYMIDEEMANRLTTVIAGEKTTLIHPCEQCKAYLDRAETCVKEIISGNLSADAIAYCYNYHNIDGNILADSRYNDVCRVVKLYYQEDIVELQKRIADHFRGGGGKECFSLLEKGFAEPRRFMDKAGYLLKEDGFLKEFAPNTDQARAERGVIAHVKNIVGQDCKKQVFIINGGPGTGKTIVGMRLLCKFIKLNKSSKCIKSGYSFHPLYMIKSIAVRNYIKNIVTSDFSNRYITSGPMSKNFPRGKETSYRIALYDECHWLGNENNPSDTINSLLDNYDIVVFLMDERQCVAGKYRSPERLIKEVIESRKDAELNHYYQLKTQMRCDSSDDYIKWVESLVYGELPYPKDRNIKYDFHICESASEMKRIIDAKASEGYSARICAGYCWPWHSELKDNNGIFHDDIVIGDFHMPWNTYKFGKKEIIPPKGYVSKEEWAFRKEGINQVGCIYTTQGLEFNYIGVIVGPDMYVENSVLKTNPAAHNAGIRKDKDGNPVDWDSIFNKSSEDLKDIFIRNIYRVLLTRGMKGCYVYFCDPELRKYVEEKMPVFIRSDQ